MRQAQKGNELLSRIEEQYHTLSKGIYRREL